MMRFYRLFALATLLLGGMNLAAEVSAQVRVAADAVAPFDQSVVRKRNPTMTLLAYSDDGAGRPLTVINQRPFNSANLGAGAPPVVAGRTITVGAGIIAAGRVYSPVVGFVAVGKTLTDAFVASVTNTPGVGSGFSDASWLVAKPQIPLPDRVRAQVTVGGAGSAAAEAIDPFLLDPGVYEYNPTILSALLEVSAAPDFAGMSFFAYDSRSTEPLWQLNVLATGTLSAASDLDILFTHDPSRLVLSSGVTPASIQDGVRNRFTVANGTAAYSNEGSVPLFTSQYDTGPTEVSFSEGLNVGATASADAPGSLPTALACAIPGILSLWLRHRRK